MYTYRERGREREIAHQKSTPQKSPWSFSGISKWMFSGIFLSNCVFAISGVQHFAPTPAERSRTRAAASGTAAAAGPWAPLLV